MKTISEWFLELPDGYSELAIKYCRDSRRKYASLASAIDHAFPWNLTKEGHEWWRQVFNYYRQQADALPPLPTYIIKELEKKSLPEAVEITELEQFI